MPNRKLRYVTRNIHKNLFDWVNQRTATDKIFRAKLVERMWKMEGLISEAKNLHCLSKAKYRWLNKIQIQAYMIASAINLKRLAAFFILLILYLQNLKQSRYIKLTYYFL